MLSVIDPLPSAEAKYRDPENQVLDEKNYQRNARPVADSAYNNSNHSVGAKHSKRETVGPSKIPAKTVEMLCQRRGRFYVFDVSPSCALTAQQHMQ